MDPLVFRSRIDPLLAGVIVVPIGVVIGLVLQRAIVRGQAPGGVIIAILALTVGLVAWTFATTSYRFGETDLLVQSGPLRVRLPLSQIRRVTRTHSVLSAPALSLQRLELTNDKQGIVVISPKDEPTFLATLKAKAPNAELPAGK